MYVHTEKMCTFNVISCTFFYASKYVNINVRCHVFSIRKVTIFHISAYVQTSYVSMQ